MVFACACIDYVDDCFIVTATENRSVFPFMPQMATAITIGRSSLTVICWESKQLLGPLVLEPGKRTEGTASPRAGSIRCEDEVRVCSTQVMHHE